MKKITLLTLFLFGLNIAAAQAPGIEWQYSDAATSTKYKVNSVIQTSDGGAVIVGYKLAEDNTTFLIRKLDQNGALVWESDLYADQNVYGIGYDVIEGDDGYFIVGEYYIGDYVEFGYALVKINLDGEFIYMDPIPNPDDWEGGYNLTKLILSSDGNIVMSGINRIAKVNQDGDIIWNNELGSNVLYYINDLIETSDGNYALAGRNSGSGGNSQNMIMKISSGGTAISQNYYGDTYQYNATSILASNDGGIILAAASHTGTGNNGTEDDYWVAEINAENEIVWDNSYGGTGVDVPYSIAKTADGGYVLTGKTSSLDGDLDAEPVGNQDNWVVKIDAEGTLEWQKRLGIANKYNGGLSVVQAADLGYLVTGFAGGGSSSATSGNNLEVYKLSATLSGNLALSQNIDACDDTFSPVITLTNSGSETITSVEISFYLDGEAAQTYEWTGTLAANATTDITLPELTASSGTHIFHSFISGINSFDFDGISVLSNEFQINQFVTASVTLELQLDDYPEETTWELKNSAGTVLYSGGPYAIQGNLITETFELAENECYTFTINDDNNDGILEGTEGYYKLATLEGADFAENGDFGNTESVNFFILENLGVRDLASNSFNIFPNPASSVLNIQSTGGLDIQKVSISNVTGQLVTARLAGNQIDVSGLSSGVYFIKIEDTKSNTETYKIIKE